MISIDTNVLLYGLNRDCPEYDVARDFLAQCSERSDVAIAELVLVELYMLLRNPVVVGRPLDATAAAAVCQRFRSHPRWALIENAPVMSQVWEIAARPECPRRRLFDARIALTLRHHGVRELATRNTGDFDGFGFERVFDPLVP